MGEAASPTKDIMMAVSSEHALREAELLTLRQISDALNTTNDRLGRIDISVSDARERLARMEVNNDSIKHLKAEVALLKADLEQRKGAGLLMKWLREYAPWLAFLVAAVATLSGRIHIG